MDKLINYIKSCIRDKYLVPNQFVGRDKGCSILNIDTAKFDLNKALSLVPKAKADAGVTVLFFEAGFNEKTRKPYNASIFVGTPNAKDDKHIEASFGNV
tara:strand:- start:4838 stop:5134 length:297 start_codon:yes stop_codon:yes gene_type:complete